MKEIKNVMLCGLGAVGTVYAYQINQFDSKNFRVLLDKSRLDKYSKEPVIYNGQITDFQYILPGARDFQADLILITTKISGLHEALEQIADFVKDDTIIIPLLNGVTSEIITAERFGWEHVLYGYFIGHSAVRDGRYIKHDGVNTLVFGSEYLNDERVLAVADYFKKAGINYQIPENIKRSVWLKYMLNVCANPTTALLRMSFGEMIENKSFMALAVKIMREVQEVAKAEGVTNTESMIDETIANLKTMSPEGKTSMLQDIEAGRKTEIDMFAGTVVDYGIKHNIPTPYCKILKEFFDIIHENQSIKLLK